MQEIWRISPPKRRRWMRRRHRDKARVHWQQYGSIQCDTKNVAINMCFANKSHSSLTSNDEHDGKRMQSQSRHDKRNDWDSLVGTVLAADKFFFQWTSSNVFWSCTPHFDLDRTECASTARSSGWLLCLCALISIQWIIIIQIWFCSWGWWLWKMLKVHLSNEKKSICYLSNIKLVNGHHRAIGPHWLSTYTEYPIAS